MRKVTLLGLTLILVLAIIPQVFAQDEETFALTILHTNDTHANHDANSAGHGGVARQATVMKQIAEEGGNVILLDGGDRFTGTLFHTQYQGQDQVQVMNTLGYDGMTLGNHEFDNGDDILAAFIDGLNFPVVTANVDFSASPVLADRVLPYAIVEVGDKQVGIIGLVTYETPDLSSPGPELVFDADYLGIANALAAELTEQGINKIFLLTHTGINDDLAIIEQLENIDVFIGGHSHTLMSNQNSANYDFPLRYTSPLGEPILYVQAGSNNLYLGRLDVVFDANGVITTGSGDTIFLSRYITPDPEVQALVDELAAPIEEFRNTSVGASTAEELNGNRVVCRVEECSMGNLLADSMRWEAKAQIALMNGGGIRASIDAGDITLGEVLTVQPFGNQMSTFQLLGSDLVVALENGVSRLNVVDGAVSREDLQGRFLQVSGLRYTIDATQEAGSRIVSVEVLEGEDYVPLDPAATYSLVTLNFVRTGGDGFSVFAENAINPYDFGRLDYEVTVDYLATLGEISAEQFAPQGRINYVNAEPAPLD